MNDRPERRRPIPTVIWRDLSNAHRHLERMPDFNGAGAVLLQGWVAA